MKTSTFGQALLVSTLLLSLTAHATIYPPDPGLAQPAFLIEDNRYFLSQGGDGDGDGFPESYYNYETPPVQYNCSGCSTPRRIWKDWKNDSFFAFGDLGFTMDINGGASAYSDYDWGESKSVFDIVFQPVGYDAGINGWYYTTMSLSGYQEEWGDYGYGGGGSVSVTLYEGNSIDPENELFKHTGMTSVYGNYGNYSTVLTLDPSVQYRLVIESDAYGPSGHTIYSAAVILERGDPATYPATADVDPWGNVGEIIPDETREIPVAIMSSGHFDATEIITASLKFAPGGVAPVSGPFFADLNGDSVSDALYTFQNYGSGITCELPDVDLVGTTSNNISFVATDDIVTPVCDDGCHP